MHNLQSKLAAAGLSPEDIAWFEHRNHRKFAPLPDCKLRKLAEKAGFLSSADFLRYERERVIHEATL